MTRMDRETMTYQGARNFTKAFLFLVFSSKFSLVSSTAPLAMMAVGARAANSANAFIVVAYNKDNNDNLTYPRNGVSFQYYVVAC